jgi:hypothetical protein
MAVKFLRAVAEAPIEAELPPQAAIPPHLPEPLLPSHASRPTVAPPAWMIQQQVSLMLAIPGYFGSDYNNICWPRLSCMLSKMCQVSLVS